MGEYLPVRCPYCGERAEVDFDDDGWSRQQFVQDCPVCCQPWNVSVVYGADGGASVYVTTLDE